MLEKVKVASLSMCAPWLWSPSLNSDGESMRPPTPDPDPDLEADLDPGPEP